MLPRTEIGDRAVAFDAHKSEVTEGGSHRPLHVDYLGRRPRAFMFAGEVGYPQQHESSQVPHSPIAGAPARVARWWPELCSRWGGIDLIRGSGGPSGVLNLMWILPSGPSSSAPSLSKTRRI